MVRLGPRCQACPVQLDPASGILGGDGGLGTSYQVQEPDISLGFEFGHACKPKVGINPFAVLNSAATGASAYDKVIDLLVRASRPQLICMEFLLSPWTPWLQHEPFHQALMDEQVYALYKSTRVLLEPFRELCIHLAPRAEINVPRTTLHPYMP